LVITIAVGVGSNAAVYGFMRGLIAPEMPATTLGVYSVFKRDAGREVAPLSANDFRRLESDVRDFEWLGAAREVQSTVETDHEEILSVAAMTPPVAAMLGLSFAGGAIISEQTWETSFQGRRDVRGQSFRIDGRDTRVGGIAPAALEGLYLGRNVDVWIPLDDPVAQGADGDSKTLWVFGKLRSGASPSQAEAAVRALRGGDGRMAMVRYTGVTPDVADGLTRIHTLITIAAGAVFLIVCANVASLLLSRATARARETSLRIALGATRRQLVAQALSDSVFIAGAGGAFGMLLAVWTSYVIPALLFEADAKYLAVTPDLTSIALAAVGCTAVTVVCGLAPLFEARLDRPAVVLRRESMGPSTATTRLRKVLIVAEMAACCALVIATGLLVQSFRAAVQTEAGRAASHSILATVQTDREGPDYFQHVDTAVRAAATVSRTTWVARPPGNRAAWRSFRVEPPRLPLRDVTMDVAAFTADMTNLIEMPPVAGRLFAGTDGPSGCRVAVVNDVAADVIFHGAAVGTSIEDSTGRRVEIIGVVRRRDAANQAAPERPTIYYSLDQTRLPLGRAGPARFRMPATRTLPSAILSTNVVSTGYFDGMGVSAVSGQLLPRARAPRSCRVGVINQEAADQYFGGNAVGSTVIDAAGRRTEIIGVVSSATLGRLERRAEPTVFFPMYQEFVTRMTLIVDAGLASDSTVATIHHAVDGVPGRAPNAPPVVERLDQHLGRTSLAPLRIGGLFVRVFAVLALALAILGVHGALTDATQRRRREIGIRMALGAQSWRVIGLVLGEGVYLAAIGAAVGLLGAIGVRQLLRQLVPAPPIVLETWLAGPLVLLVVVLVASVLPAMRALRIDPLRVLQGND
jgi:ABC-type lipoprotein release transport system permease subunit